MRRDNRGYDRCPEVQRHKSNSAAMVLQIFGACFFVTLAVLGAVLAKDSPKLAISAPLVFLVLAGMSLFALYEGRAELSRIDQIEAAIEGERDADYQSISGVYKEELVQFFVGRPPSINYGIVVNGQEALAVRESIEQFVAHELRAIGAGRYKVLMTENAVILTKSLLIAFQLKPAEALLVYDILVRAKREVVK